MSKIESLARVLPLRHFACGFHFIPCPRLPLAVVLSALEGLIVVPVGTMVSFLLEDNHFKTVKGLVDYVEDQEHGARASPSNVDPGGKF